VYFLAFSFKFKGNYGKQNTATTKRLILPLLLPDFPGFVFQLAVRKSGAQSAKSAGVTAKVGFSFGSRSRGVGVGVEQYLISCH